MKNIAIIGGNGFIGTNTAIELANNGYNVTILDKNKNSFTDERIEYNQVNALDYKKLLYIKLRF